MDISDAALARAASLFGVEASGLRLLGGLEGLAYQFERDEEQLVLKIASSSDDGPERMARMQETLGFVSYLADNGVCVARPVNSLRGVWVEWVESDDGNYIASVATKATGHHVNRRDPMEWNSHLFQKWGQVTGRMHALAKTYHTWRREPEAGGPQTSILDWQQEFEFFANWCQEDDVRAKWFELGEQLQRLPQTRDCYGLIHKDLHPSNFLVDEGEITVIDFDVCSYHWFATDIAIPLFFADWIGTPNRSQAREAFLASFFNDFMAGYNRENRLDPFWIKQVPLFLKHHQILLFIVFTDEWKTDPNEWQTNQLKKWRHSILNEVPVVRLPF